MFFLSVAQKEEWKRDTPVSVICSSRSVIAVLGGELLKSWAYKCAISEHWRQLIGPDIDQGTSLQLKSIWLHLPHVSADLGGGNVSFWGTEFRWMREYLSALHLCQRSQRSLRENMSCHVTFSLPDIRSSFVANVSAGVRLTGALPYRKWRQLWLTSGWQRLALRP